MPRWLIWLVLTLLSWGIWAVLSRAIESSATPAQSQALSTLGLAPIIVALWFMKDPAPEGPSRWGVALALGGGVVSCVGNIAYFAALGDAKAATIVPLTAMYPAVTILLAVPVLKERVTALQWGGMATSLAAIYLFNEPGRSSGASVGLLSALAAIGLWGLAALMQKASTSHLSGVASAYWFLLAFVPVGALILLFNPLPAGVAGRTWALAVALGFTLGFGNLTILLAYAAGGKAAVIAPLSGLYPLASIPIAVVVFGEEIKYREQAGIVLSLIAVVMLSCAPDPTIAASADLQGDRAS
jgi:drug/metabolite transporter (DMT)-like permease